VSPRPEHLDGPVERSPASRRAKNLAFAVLCWVTAGVAVVVLGVLLSSIAAQGLSYLRPALISAPPSRNPASAGLGPAMWGSIWICAVCAVTALPLGVGTAIFLEEYKPKSRLVKRLHGFVQLNIANLAGVPSIVYGIIGLTVFVQMFGVLGNPNEPAYTIGQRWYDAFAMVDGTQAHVRVDGRDAPSLVATPELEFVDGDGDALAVRLVAEAEIRPALDALEERVDAERPAITERVEAEGLTGRAKRRAVRTAVSRLRTEHIRAELPDVLLVGTEPTRVDRKSFFYVQAPFGRGVLAGGLTLMLVILPIVILSSQEALRSVPGSLREGALGLGATRWQMVSRMTLPAAIPGIMTGSILAMSRAIGEAAPILIIAGIVFVRFTPEHLMDEFTAMPLQIFDWAGRPQEEFHRVAASGIIVLLAVLLTFNAAAVFIRQRFQRPMQ
jgi:phosphate transport system permease protein